MTEHLKQFQEERRGLNLEQTHAVRTPASAITVDGTYVLFQDGRKAADDLGGIIRRVQFTPDAGVATNGTDYITLTVRRLNAAGASQATLATLNTSAAAWTAEVALDLGVTDVTYNAGDAIDVVVTHAGAGKAVPGGLWSIETVRLGGAQ